VYNKSRTPTSSPCQLGLGVDLSCYKLRSYAPSISKCLSSSTYECLSKGRFLVFLKEEKLRIKNLVTQIAF